MEIRIIPIYHFNQSTKHPTFQIPVFIRSPRRHHSNGKKNAKRRKNRQNQVCLKSTEKITQFEVIYFEKSELTPDHKNGIHLWQFLLSLLRQPKFEKHIKWIDQGRGKWEQSEVIIAVLKVLRVWTTIYC